ncbi:hypothetical protein [Ectothiorhodospira lacustris]|uniref:hypothetical protein n=1 Tax=Ectothiorhodospira lacustris TaxID=2899127 RepID=UPI001EE8548E|nr:hypothetical protein [Ectothiorhodospira lacustris]MCG5500105.1 hypothetical protein [Ectothiorhodospira lacustris]MCG5510810.1 hypothetical protein [Ectothiorhodospira lacustris]MCG5522542.1 hypothetical protein [Ectothiorhodospira lacustris]
MNQAEAELQLKVWKELAVSKQMLMKGATDALGLDPECSTEELKSALDVAIQRGNEADVKIKQANEQARQAIDAMEKKVKASEKAQILADAARNEALARLQSGEQDMAAERVAHTKEMKSIKELLAEKDKALKTINKALADTPENVMKKLRQLKKQKHDEATARKQLETQLSALRKEKRELDEKLGVLQASLESGAKLVEQYRELRKVSEQLLEQAKGAVGEEAPALPELDAQLLEGIEQAAAAK